MSKCFHPHLFDAERFRREADELDADDLDMRIMLATDCIDGEVDVDTLVPDEDTFSARRHPTTGDYLGGVVDAVRAGFGARTRPAKLLLRASCLDGPFSEVEPQIGILMPSEIAELEPLLAGAVLEPRGLDADRKLLLRLFAIARERGRGLLFLAV